MSCPVNPKPLPTPPDIPNQEPGSSKGLIVVLVVVGILVVLGIAFYIWKYKNCFRENTYLERTYTEVERKEEEAERKKSGQVAYTINDG